MTAEHKYEMTISLQIVEHLGLNLYSNTSAVISEAVANAWDADAKTVEITLEKDCITIKDDGCGMDTDDINNKYLTVGYQKRHLVPITPMLNRKVMGRKGIGKLWSATATTYFGGYFFPSSDTSTYFTLVLCSGTPFSSINFRASITSCFFSFGIAMLHLRYFSSFMAHDRSVWQMPAG